MNIARNIVTQSNWDAGRGGKSVTGIVLHTMVGYIQGAENRFNNPTSQVSVHYGIGLDGAIRQWVDEANTAWQAGNYAINQTTIGIEHEDYANANDSTRTTALYASSAALVADICKRYGFPADSSHIFLHKNVIDTTRYPGGTACPDGLDTNKITSMAAALLKGGDTPMVNRGDIVNIYRAAIGRDPNENDLTFWDGKDWKAFIYDLVQRPDFAQQYKTTNHDSVLSYIKDNLK